MSVAAMPGVYRSGRPSGNFTVIAHDFARSDLPARAVKVGLYLLGHTEGYQQTQAQMARTIGLAVRTVAAALRDLAHAGYLRTAEVRNKLGHRIGTRYEITDSPQPVDNPVDNSPETLSATSASALCAAPKKTKPRRGFRKKTRKTPSGGTAAAAAPPTLDARAEEEPMKIITEEPPALFDLPELEKPQAQGREGSPSAKTVAAAYVDSFRHYHSGMEPLRRDIGRVARDAKALLGKGEAGPEELTAAAKEMGSGPYSNLAMALKIHRDRKPGGNQGFAPASPHTTPYWQDIGLDKQERWVQELLANDETLAWVRKDPAEVQRLCAAHPELAVRFGRVA